MCFAVSSHASHIDDEKRRSCNVGLVRLWRRCSVHEAAPVSESLQSKNEAKNAVAEIDCLFVRVFVALFLGVSVQNVVVSPAIVQCCTGEQ